MTFCNVYAFTPQGQRLIIGLGLPYHEAVSICEAQLEYLPPVERYGDIWLDTRDDNRGGCRLVIYYTNIDPFVESNDQRTKWLEWIEL
jgi:hypothetical protein